MRWGRRYFAVQALAGAAWWLGVFLSPLIRDATLGALDPIVLAALDLPLFVGASAVAAFGSRIAAAVATGWTALVAVGMVVYASVSTEAGWGALIMLAAAGASALALLLLSTGSIPTHWLVVGPFRFRSAGAGRRAATNLRDTALQTLVFWSLFLGVIPVVISLVEQRWRLGLDLPAIAWPVGAVLLVGGSALGVWSGATMSAVGGGTPLPAAMPNRLVIAGPYRFVRNPMAVAGIVQGVGVGLMLSSWLVVGYAILGSLVWNTAIRPLEEADLEARFGSDFQRYRRDVRCWLPIPRTLAATSDRR